jgi:hypothetical protein
MSKFFVRNPVTTEDYKAHLLTCLCWAASLTLL